MVSWGFLPAACGSLVYIYKDSDVNKIASPWCHELCLSVKDISYSFIFFIKVSSKVITPQIILHKVSSKKLSLAQTFVFRNDTSYIKDVVKG